MKCEWRGCRRDATETIVGGLFEPTRVVCSPCREEIDGTLVVPAALLPRLWWPTRNQTYRSHRAVIGHDWRPL